MDVVLSTNFSLPVISLAQSVAFWIDRSMLTYIEAFILLPWLPDLALLFSVGECTPPNAIRTPHLVWRSSEGGRCREDLDSYRTGYLSSSCLL